MSAQQFRVGSPRELEATNEIVKEHAKVKKNVVDALKKLADDVEGLVLEHIEQELNEIWWDALGRKVIVGGGVISFALLPYPVLSAAVGIGACVVGYIIVGKSIYECRANGKKRIEKMKEIYELVSNQLDRYEKSKQTVLIDLKSYGLTQGNDFQGNMRRMKKWIDDAENSLTYGCFNELEDFLKKVKTQYLELGPDLQKTLQEKFMMDTEDMMKIGTDVGTAAAGLAGDIFTGVTHGAAGVGAAGVGTAIGKWGNIFQTINIMINGAFLYRDYEHHTMLEKMKKDWKGDNKEEIQKEEKFKKYFGLKDEINKIRDELNARGY
eukprot:GFUD01024542.1.p1 GENE.GFUD01024542.1~~GFUD01024542.1.p1  ORF type:complete len:323 (-),score=53.82 GFUD01024542.1:66-1034(-)